MSGDALRTRIEVRVAELQKDIAALEARNAPTNEPMIRQLRAQLAELETLLAGDADWRARIRERVASAIGDYQRKRRRR